MAEQTWQAKAMERAAYERGCNAMRDRIILLIEARYESGYGCEPWMLVKELRRLDNPTDQCAELAAHGVDLPVGGKA